MNKIKNENKNKIMSINTAKNLIKLIITSVGLSAIFISSTVGAQVTNSNSKSGQYLSDRAGTESRNSKGSCDSTCSAMGGISMTSMESILQQKVVPCGPSFTGNKVQQRSTDKDGN